MYLLSVWTETTIWQCGRAGDLVLPHDRKHLLIYLLFAAVHEQSYLADKSCLGGILLLGLSENEAIEL